MCSFTNAGCAQFYKGLVLRGTPGRSPRECVRQRAAAFPARADPCARLPGIPLSSEPDSAILSSIWVGASVALTGARIPALVATLQQMAGFRLDPPGTTTSASGCGSGRSTISGSSGPSPRRPTASSPSRGTSAPFFVCLSGFRLLSRLLR